MWSFEHEHRCSLDVVDACYSLTRLTPRCGSTRSTLDYSRCVPVFKLTSRLDPFFLDRGKKKMVNIAIIATLVAVLIIAGIAEGESLPYCLTTSLFRCSRRCSCGTRVPRHRCIARSIDSRCWLHHCICCLTASFTCINCLACLLIRRLTIYYCF